MQKTAQIIDVSKYRAERLAQCSCNDEDSAEPPFLWFAAWVFVPIYFVS